MSDGIPHLSGSANADLDNIKRTAPNEYDDVFDDVRDLVYWMRDKRPIVGSIPPAWAVEVRHHYSVVFSIPTLQSSTFIWVLMVCPTSELISELSRYVTSQDPDGTRPKP